ncbi:MAG: hypothetical protein IJ479_04425, partial [Alphaproteobacteria bacterium]|nr:hypothetical protein [Alphaproteobacteria bacterium]
GQINSPSPSGLRGVVLHFRFLLQNLSYSHRAPQTVPNERLCFVAFVILGLVPRIHEETGTVSVMRWIAGSKSGNDKRESLG